MIRFSQLARGGVAVGVIATAASAAAQDPPLRTLSVLDVEYAEPFSCVSGLRELSDGRVVVADVKEKTVQLIDMRRGTATRIGQQGQGPGEWSTPVALFALPGDTTLLLDPQNQRFLVIHPNGSVGRTFTVDLGGGARGGLVASRPSGIDAIGRLYYQGSSFSFNEGSPPVSLDSAPIIRFDRRTSKIDTLTWLPLPKSDVQTSGSPGSGSVSIRMSGPNPLAAQRAWAVAPDGRIAFAHGDPYRVEWLSSTGTRVAGPAVRYAARRVTEADKAPQASPDCSVSISFGGGGGGRGDAQIRTAVSAVGGGAGRGAGTPARTDWPEAMPPFAPVRFGAVRVAPTGELWVPRSRALADAPTYDIFDATGKLVSRMAMPKGTRLLGFGKATVYAYRMDEDDLVYLQRYRLDAAR